MKTRKNQDETTSKKEAFLPPENFIFNISTTYS